MRFSGGVYFETNISNDYSSFFPRNEEKDEWGSVYVINRENCMKNSWGVLMKIVIMKKM